MVGMERGGIVFGRFRAHYLENMCLCWRLSYSHRVLMAPMCITMRKTRVVDVACGHRVFMLLYILIILSSLCPKIAMSVAAAITSMPLGRAVGVVTMAFMGGSVSMLTLSRLGQNGIPEVTEEQKFKNKCIEEASKSPNPRRVFYEVKAAELSKLEAQLPK